MKIERVTKHDAPTSCIKHLAVSGLSRGTARSKSNCNLKGKYLEMPNVSYTQPLVSTVRTDTVQPLTRVTIRHVMLPTTV